MSFLAKKTAKTVAIVPVADGAFGTWLKKLDPKTRAWVDASGFTGAAGSFLLLPNGQGAISRVIFGVGADDSVYTYADLPARLPKNAGGYYIAQKMTAERATAVALGWALGCYQFTRYKSGKKKEFVQLAWPENADKKAVTVTVDAIFRARDLINTPAADLGPDELEAAARKLAREHKAAITVTAGDAAMRKNFPTVYAVGQGSPRPPRVIDIRWGNPKNPKVTLVGKGIIFDTGGLNMKPGSAMELMKKDMGGGALAMSLGAMIMAHNLPVRVRVIVPVAENCVDGKSFRMSDVVKTRKGITVEIGNTDAEGRLVLCDGIAAACDDKPDLLMDFGTLTGHARAALGPDLPNMFCNDDAMAEALLAASKRVQDPMWRMPLWAPYLEAMSSKIADIRNDGGHAGAITCALYLQQFVDKGIKWVHIDYSGWNFGSRPGRPEGGEVMGLRAHFEFIRTKFGKKNR